MVTGSEGSQSQKLACFSLTFHWGLTLRIAQASREPCSGALEGRRQKVVCVARFGVQTYSQSLVGFLSISPLRTVQKGSPQCNKKPFLCPFVFQLDPLQRPTQGVTLRRSQEAFLSGRQEAKHPLMVSGGREKQETRDLNTKVTWSYQGFWQVLVALPWERHTLSCCLLRFYAYAIAVSKPVAKTCANKDNRFSHHANERSLQPLVYQHRNGSKLR